PLHKVPEKCLLTVLPVYLNPPHFPIPEARSSLLSEKRGKSFPGSFSGLRSSLYPDPEARRFHYIMKTYPPNFCQGPYFLQYSPSHFPGLPDYVSPLLQG